MSQRLLKVLVGASRGFPVNHDWLSRTGLSLRVRTDHEFHNGTVARESAHFRRGLPPAHHLRRYSKRGTVVASLTPGRAAVLNSWKEIAAYLCRGVRTAQRWEHDLGLPVHRPRGKDRSAVIALPSEIDSWLHSAPSHELKQAVTIAGTCLLRTRLHESLERRCAPSA